jgi:hypothetical protein
MNRSKNLHTGRDQTPKHFVFLFGMVDMISLNFLMGFGSNLYASLSLFLVPWFILEDDSIGSKQN